MKITSFKIYYYYYPQKARFLLYILFNLLFIFSHFYYKPKFIFKYRIRKPIKVQSNYTPPQNDKIINKQKYSPKINTSITTPFPIDLVYTWVDGRDEKWQEKFIKANKERQITYRKKDFMNRFVDIEDIRYSLRSAEQNLPWIRLIFIVTWSNQHPDWLNLSNPRLRVISQSEIFPPNVILPTFNSRSIDFSLYKIPGLSEHFIYSNDDMYFGRPLNYTDFFTIEGKPIIYSKQNNWSMLVKRFKKFSKSYNRRKNDGDLFMVSIYYTVITFKEKFGRVMPYEYSHIPTPFTKTICSEVHSNFKEEVDDTISHRFRNESDFQMQTIMIQYGLYSNQSVVRPKTDDDAIFIIASKTNKMFKKINVFIDNMPKLMSINIDEMRYRNRIKAFLDCVFDKPSSFELKNKPPSVDQNLRKNFAERDVDFLEKEKVYTVLDLMNDLASCIRKCLNSIKYLIEKIDEFLRYLGFGKFANN